TKSRGCGMPSTGNLYQSFTPSVSNLAGFDLQLRAGGSFPGAVSYPMTTILLISNVASDAAGVARAEELVHITFKSGITAIYASPSENTVRRLADVLGLPVNIYDSSNIQDLINDILSVHSGGMVAVAGNKNDIAHIIELLGGYPTPIIYPDEHDNIIVTIINSEGEAKVINLQYGLESPISD
ncbi:MAG: hypothetical protein JSV32_02745, partial [Dehalococcoidia bacterium]